MSGRVGPRLAFRRPVVPRAQIHQRFSVERRSVQIVRIAADDLGELARVRGLALHRSVDVRTVDQRDAQ